MDVLEMRIEDSMSHLDPNPEQVEYSQDYLVDCRIKLMKKVTLYREQLEEAISNHARFTAKHRQEIESIRSFYKNLLHAPTRTGKIVKVACTTSNVAVEIMEELGLKCKYDGDSYCVSN